LALLEAAAHEHGILMADMTRTQFCDSSGLHTLLAAHKRAQAEGGELLLAIAAAPVLRVLAITSIDRMIPTSRPWMRPSRKRPPTGRTAIGELDEKKPVAVASASLGIPDRVISSGADSCAFAACGMPGVRG
jgi:STAS domain